MIQKIRLSACCFFATLAIILAVQEANGREIRLPEARGDAELTDVFFLDADRGWAVGDRGVVWRTDDGGRNWVLQTTPVAGRLESVQFVSGDYGWAVGGAIAPYTHATSAIVLHTEDGGKHWRSLPMPGLPGLKQLKFFDGRHGWAVGTGSALYPGAVFRTTDGGKAWAAVSGGEKHSWLGGDFASMERGLVVGRLGAAHASPTGFDFAATVELRGRAVRKVKLASPQLAWAVGDGGLVLRSLDGGESWSTPAGPVPEAARGFDWRGLSAVGEQVWIVGSPGSMVLHSGDAGRSWKLTPTGQTAPLHAVTFLDDGHGWAVGALGAILASRDKGESWRPQRSGGQRLAMLGVYARGEHAPLALFARHAADEGYLSACELLNPDEKEAAVAGASLEDRVQAAFVACGASAAAIFDPQPSEQAVQERLVLAIRQWRPEVLVTDDADPTDARGERHTMNQRVLAAVEMAADDEAYPHHAAMGLKAWQVNRVYGLLPAGKPGSISIAPLQLAPRLGCTLSDIVTGGSSLLAREPRQTPSASFRLLVNQATHSSGQGDFFSSIAGAPGETLRRTLGRPVPGNLAELKRLAQKRRLVEAMLGNIEGESFGGDSWIAHVEDLGRGIEAQAAGELLFELACDYERRQRPDLAAEVRRVLVEQTPSHELCAPAWLKLINFHASEEAARRFGRPPLRRAGPIESTPEITPVVAMLPDSVLAPENLALVPIDPAEASALAEPSTSIEQLRAEATTLPRPGGVTLARADVKIDEAAKEIERAQANRHRLVSWGASLERRFPELFAEAALRFPLLAASRRDRSPGEIQRSYQTLTSRATGDWQTCALGELWLARPDRRPPKPVARSRFAEERPYLDGRFEEPCWLEAQPIELRSRPGATSPPARVSIAHDDEFLYLAIESPWLDDAAIRTAEPAKGRPRDADLAGRDRLDLMFDIDRDYATSYRLSVDRRGWTCDACLGDAAWNPTWYVASEETSAGWRIEAAVRLADLTAEPPKAGDAWGLGIERWHRETITEDWLSDSALEVASTATEPATERRFGYLRFED